MRQFKLIFILSLMIVLVGGLSHWGHAAVDSKIKIVDMNRALQSVSAGKKAKNTLEAEFKKKEKDILAKEESLKKRVEEFQKQAMVMNDQARGKKEAELQKELVEHQQVRAQTGMEFQKKEQQATEPIIKNLKAVVEDMAKKGDYEMVLEKTAVIYSKSGGEITDDLVKEYDKRHK